MKNGKTIKREPRFEGEVSKRSHKNMSCIRGKDTGIEVILRKALWANGYLFRKKYKELSESPDIALTKYKIAVFCDSEFFHGKDWDMIKVKLEKGMNSGYWISKIQRNMERNLEKDKILRFEGWKVSHFWS